jgi:hypothetical protein
MVTCRLCAAAIHNPAILWVKLWVKATIFSGAGGQERAHWCHGDRSGAGPVGALNEQKQRK